MTTARAQRASILGLVALMLTVAVYVLQVAHDTVAFYDEWGWIAYRRGMTADALLAPHNGHLSLVPVVAFKGLLQVAGLTNYWLFRVVLVIAHLTCVALVFLLARGRVGTVGAAFAAAFVAVLGAAADDLVWAFQIGFVGGVAFGLGALLALDARTRRGDAIAAVLLGLSLASASVGAAFLIVAAVEIVLDPRRRERWWVIAAPLVLYAAWYLGYGESQTKRENLDDAPLYAAESGAAAIGGLAGLTIEYGRTLLVGLVAVVAAYLARERAPASRLVALAVALPAIWVLTALSRAQFNEPAAPRYIYTGAVLIVLLLCELARGRQVTRAAPALMLGALLAFAAVANAKTLDNMSNGLRENAAELRARLGAMALTKPNPDFVPAPRLAPGLQARSFEDVQRDFGRIAFSLERLRRAPQAEGVAADDTLVRAGNLAITKTGGEEGAGCRRVPATSGDTRTNVTLAPGDSVRIGARGSAGVLARRFADAFGQTPVTEIPAGGAVLLRAARDRASDPWRLQVGSAGAIEVCRAG